jgi:hypothetical protein
MGAMGVKLPGEVAIDRAPIPSALRRHSPAATVSSLPITRRQRRRAPTSAGS